MSTARPTRKPKKGTKDMTTKRTDHTTKTSNGSYLVHTRNGNYEARNCGGHSCWALYAPAGNLTGYYRSLKQILEHLLGRGIIEDQTQSK
jgi:hypothetical protein